MLNLMKLEIQKLSISSYLKSVVIINLIVITFMSLPMYLFENYTNLYSYTSIFLSSIFTVFSSVLLSKLIIEEFKNKTITVMFMYPISRKKILISKLLVIVIITFTSTLISCIFSSICLSFISKIFNFIPASLTFGVILKSFISFVMYSLSASFIGLIPLYFGMKKKSVPTTIVSAIIIVFITNSNSNGFSLSSIIIIPIALSLIGALIAYLSIKNIENEDLIN